MYESITFHLFWGKYPEREVVVEAPTVHRDGAAALCPIITIGMRDDADLYLDDLRIAGQYLEVILLDDGPYLVNQVQMNDTFRINGKRALKISKLELGDTITVSKSRLLIKDLVVLDRSSVPGNAADLELEKQLEQEARDHIEKYKRIQKAKTEMEEEERRMVKKALVALGIIGACVAIGVLLGYFFG